MMVKRICRGLSMVIALMVCFAMTVPALAATVTYTPVHGETVTLTNYLVVDRSMTSQNLSNYKFEFTLVAVQASDDVKNVKTGPDPVPTVAAVTFNSAKPVTVTEEIKTLLGTKYNEDKHLVYVSPVTLDFSKVSFPEPGVYRYKLTMKTPTIAGLTYDASPVRYVDVFVENDGSDGAELGDLKTTVVVHTTTDGAIAPDFSYNTGKDENDEAIPGMNIAEDVKIMDYINTLEAYDLTLEKHILGNQADPFKTFDFTIAVVLPDNMPAGSYTFALKQESTGGVEDAEAITATVATDGNEISDGTVKLGKDGKISISGLPKGTKVTISEVNGQYEATYTINGAATETKGNTIPEQTMNNDLSVVFTNTLEGTIPTGVLLTVAPFVALMIVGLIGVLVFLKKKHND